MRRGLMWGLYVAVFAAALYVVGLAGVPYGVMKLIYSRVGETAPLNAIYHAERPSHTSRGIVRPSPELLYSICRYDLSQGPLHIVSGAPQGTYWSVAMYRDNTDNYHVVNDTAAGGKPVNLILHTSSQLKDGKAAFEARYKISGDPKFASSVGVESPSDTGLVLIRTLINDEARLPEIDAERRQATCGPLTP